VAEGTWAPAPEGDLRSFEQDRFVSDGLAHEVYRKGRGPAVVVLTELPGISPQVVSFADRLVKLGCTAVLPDLIGTAGRDPLAGGQARVVDLPAALKHIRLRQPGVPGVRDRSDVAGRRLAAGARRR
jgi:dienelactone hydrolase